MSIILDAKYRNADLNNFFDLTVSTPKHQITYKTSNHIKEIRRYVQRYIGCVEYHSGILGIK